MERHLAARNSPLKLSLALLSLLAFLILVWWGPQRFGLTPKPGWEVARWPIAVLLGAAFAYLARGLFDRREQILIGPNGIFMREWSERTIPWSAIKRCAIKKQYLPNFVYQRHICLYLRDPSLYPPTAQPARFFGRFRKPDYGDIIMRIGGLDQNIREFMAAIKPHAAAAGVEVSE